VDVDSYKHPYSGYFYLCAKKKHGYNSGNSYRMEMILSMRSVIIIIMTLMLMPLFISNFATSNVFGQDESLAL
jgi:hypothetical protein